MRLRNKLASAACIIIWFGAGSLSAKGLDHEFVADSTFYYKTDRQTAIPAKFDFNDPAELGKFSLSFGEWKGRALPIARQPVVKPDFMFERQYENRNGESVWFQLIRGRIERAVHVPAICYYNAGWRIVEQGTEDVKIGEHSIPCGRMILEKNDRHATELYFYLWGSPDRDFMKGCVMFRVASSSREDDKVRKVNLIKKFVKDVFSQTGQTP